MATRKNLNKNAISAFEEYGVKKRENPIIEIVRAEGPAHKPVFYALASLGSQQICTETGCSKHEARSRAAERALQALNQEYDPECTNGAGDNLECEDELINPIPYKDPVSALTEYAQSIKESVMFDRIKQEGLPHMPIFSMQAKIGGQTFNIVTGSSIKDTKKRAAITALLELKKIGQLQEFFPETLNSNTSNKSKQPKESKVTLGIPGKNPVSILNEYLQKHCLTPRYEYEQQGPSHKPVFRVKTILKGEEFEVLDAQSKKEGNRLVAEQILKWLEDQGQIVLQKAKPTGASESGGKIPSSSNGESHADCMEKMTMSKIEELLMMVPESLVGRKVVAAIVMVDSNTDIYRVVSLGSGNRCIKGDHIQDTGKVLHDSHAEILARRAFKRFLYRLLRDNQGLLDTGPSGKLRFKANISFHMYISTAPCGDGALFTHSDQEKDSLSVNGHLHSPVFDNRRTQGLLRVKQENGEGTIPIEADCAGQTFDGIKHGNRLQIMSCSDKICQWNVVGLQGSLLSNFYDPIYLKSVTLGNLYHQGHLSRSLCCRINHDTIEMDKKLPYNYFVNHPDLGVVSAVDDCRTVEKSKPSCLNWNLGEKEPEITDGTTGETWKTMNSTAKASRLCKHSLLQLYRHLVDCKDELSMSYKQLKMKSDDYNQAKMTFHRRMHEQSYGNWMSMPREVDRFNH